jgi:nuclear pore complex protein Nup155
MAVPVSESSSVHLVAITNTGVRIYFSTSAPVVDDITRAAPRLPPRELTPLHVRLPPPQSAQTLRFGVQRTDANVPPSVAEHYEVHTAYYQHGVCLMADSKSEVIIVFSTSNSIGT